MKKVILILLFVITALTFGLAIYFDNQMLKGIVKPIPLICIIFLSKKNTKYGRLMLFGFLASLLGDVLLEYPFKWFIPGLLSFLLAHVFFSIAFIKNLGKGMWLSSIPFFLYGIIVYYILWPGLKEMALPVAVYVLAIVIMVWRAFVQRKISSVSGFAFIGAMLFCLSDSFIAFGKFYAPIPYGSYWVMSTYWAAQFLFYKSTE